jgi:hypothetical protein
MMRLNHALSAVTREHRFYLTLVVAVATLKLILSAVEPASYDMFSTVSLVVNNKNPLIGPWIALYPSIYLEMMNLTQLGLQQWFLASPANTNANLQLLSLLLRLPAYVFDVATLVAIYFIGKKMATPEVGRLASLVWFLNPFTLFSVELIGVLDVVATFLVVVAFGLLTSRRIVLSGIFLALGTWLKLYPIFLLPPLMLYARSQGIPSRKMVALFGLGLVGLFGYLSWIFPFGLLYLLRYSPVTQPLPFFSGGESVVDGSIFVLVVFYCLLGLFAKKGRSLLSMLISTLLIYYLISNPSPQYLIWAMPFMALDLAVSRDRFKAVLFAVFYALAFTQWFFNSSGFLTPSRYSLLLIPFAGNLSWYSQAIVNLLDWSQVKLVGVLLLPLIASGFYASAFIYAIEEARSWFGASTYSIAKNAS